MTGVKPKSIRQLAEFKQEVRPLRGSREFSQYQGQKRGLTVVIVSAAQCMV
jgi:uridine phosphorylase